jgi:glutaredoxin
MNFFNVAPFHCGRRLQRFCEELTNTHASSGHGNTNRGTVPEPIRVVIYTRAGCHLCDAAKAVLTKHQARFHLQISEVDIDRDPALQARYGDCVPVVVIQGRERFRGVVNDVLLVRVLQAQR